MADEPGNDEIVRKIVIENTEATFAGQQLFCFPWMALELIRAHLQLGERAMVSLEKERIPIFKS